MERLENFNVTAILTRDWTFPKFKFKLRFSTISRSDVGIGLKIIEAKVKNIESWNKVNVKFYWYVIWVIIIWTGSHIVQAYLDRL